MDSRIDEYFKKKYGENYAKDAQTKYDDSVSRANTGNFIGNLGEVIAGQKVGGVDSGFDKIRADAKDSTIGKIDKEKKQFAVDYDLDRKMTDDADKDVRLKSERDVNSQESKLAQSLAVKMGMNPQQAKALTADKFKTYSPALEKMYEIEQKKLDRADARATKIQERLGINKDILRLPGENQEVVKDLARKNAGKLGIANQIDSVMGGWDKLSDDQKVSQGRQLLKVLNSTEGADAIGSEEAKRLGSKLEFAMGNLFNSNPIQIGRDLSGFKDQATGTSKAIRGAINSNNSTINKMYSDVGINKDVNSGYRDPKIEQMAKDSDVSYETALDVFNSRKSKMAGR